MTLMTSGQQDRAIGAEEFGKELSAHVGRLRLALRQMLTELGSPRTPTLLQRQLGAGYTICWQIFQVARSDDQTAETQHAPSLGALKRLVGLALEKGLTRGTADVLQDTADAFHRFIRQHAEDRDYFDAMVAGATDTRHAKNVLVQRRRAAYRANSHVWGSQNDLWLVSGIVRRSATDPGHIDLIALSRQQGLRRLRADAAVSLVGMRIDPTKRDQPPGKADTLKDALDPTAAAATGMPVLPEFSTSPLPRVSCTTTCTGRRVFQWIDDSVGLKSSCDITTGTLSTGIPMPVGQNGLRQMLMSSTVRSKASAMMVIDLIVHRDTFPDVQVHPVVHEAADGVPTLDDLPTLHRFAIEEGVTHLGRATNVNLAEFPQYRSLLQYATTKAGWQLEEFDVYRLQIAYPIMGAAHCLYFYDPAQ
ncbi:MAG: hypothetical protein QM754_00095 [Tepidisphaeraceae bacterium]